MLREAVQLVPFLFRSHVVVLVVEMLGKKSFPLGLSLSHLFFLTNVDSSRDVSYSNTPFTIPTFR